MFVSILFKSIKISKVVFVREINRLFIMTPIINMIIRTGYKNLLSKRHANNLSIKSCEFKAGP